MTRKSVLRPEQHRKTAVALFNDVWELLEKRRRTRSDDLRMIHEAHASRYHWEEVGTPTNLAIGEWQVSHVYAVLKRPEPAMYHAQRCLETCKTNGIGDFPRAYAYEALARASGVAGRKRERERYARLGAVAGRSIRGDDDREQFFRDLATILRK